MIIKNFKKKASFNKIQEINKEYPKYLSSLLNYINGTMASSQTTPGKVGQMTDLIEKYKSEIPKDRWSVDTWKDWYLKENVLSNGTTGKDALRKAIDKNLELTKIAKDFLSDEKIKKVITEYLSDLIFEKTFKGLMIEKVVAYEGLKDTLQKNFIESELIKSNKSDESKNIDFLYKGIKIQVKPKTFKARNKGVQLGNYENMVFIYYEIIGNDIDISIENKDLLKIKK